MAAVDKFLAPWANSRCHFFEHAAPFWGFGKRRFKLRFSNRHPDLTPRPHRRRPTGLVSIWVRQNKYSGTMTSYEVLRSISYLNNLLGIRTANGLYFWLWLHECQEGEPGTQGKKIQEWMADKCTNWGFFSYISNANNSNSETEEGGKVEGEVCILPGSLISALGDKMGETEENVEDFRAITDIYVHTLSVIRSSLTPALWLLWLLSHPMTLSNWLTICWWDIIAA